MKRILAILFSTLIIFSNVQVSNASGTLILDEINWEWNYTSGGVIQDVEYADDIIFIAKTNDINSQYYRYLYAVDRFTGMILAQTTIEINSLQSNTSIKLKDNKIYTLTYSKIREYTFDVGSGFILTRTDSAYASTSLNKVICGIDNDSSVYWSGRTWNYPILYRNLTDFIGRYNAIGATNDLSGTDAYIGGITGCFVDSLGNFTVGDVSNSVVKKYLSDGTYVGTIGDGTRGWNELGGKSAKIGYIQYVYSDGFNTFILDREGVGNISIYDSSLNYVDRKELYKTWNDYRINSFFRVLKKGWDNTLLTTNGYEIYTIGTSQFNIPPINPPIVIPDNLAGNVIYKSVLNNTLNNEPVSSGWDSYKQVSGVISGFKVLMNRVEFDTNEAFNGFKLKIKDANGLKIFKIQPE